MQVSQSVRFTNCVNIHGRFVQNSHQRFSHRCAKWLIRWGRVTSRFCCVLLLMKHSGNQDHPFCSGAKWGITPRGRKNGTRSLEKEHIESLFLLKQLPHEATSEQHLCHTAAPRSTMPASAWAQMSAQDMNCWMQPRRVATRSHHHRQATSCSFHATVILCEMDMEKTTLDCFIPTVDVPWPTDRCFCTVPFITQHPQYYLGLSTQLVPFQTCLTYCRQMNFFASYYPITTQERHIYIPIQFCKEASVPIRTSSMAISPECPLLIIPSNTIYK